MPQIVVETEINADIEICFDLARDVGFYSKSLKDHNEIPISGKISGLVEKGDYVTWETNHLFLLRHITFKISELKKPYFFVDEVVRGEFKSYRHHHIFKKKKEKTIMVDKLDFASKYGVLGKMVDGLFYKRYLKELLITRNEILKQKAEELSKQ